MPARSRHWVFTSNNPTKPLVFDDKTVAYAVWQLEKGDSGTPHFQGYFCVPGTGIRLTGARKIMQLAGAANSHLEIKRGSIKQAVDYCKKEEGRLDGPFEFGTLPENKGQGTRTDLHGLRDLVKAKRSFADIADDDSLLPVLAKHHRFEEKLRAAYEARDSSSWRTVTVEVLWGTTGTGKTRKAMDAGAFKWSPSQPEWWDGYIGQDSICIDEFYGQLKPSRLLEILDGHPIRLPIKGGHTYAAWTHVYITSNADPDSWYTDLKPEVRKALDRRIIRITHMGPAEPEPFDFAANRDGNGTWGKF